MRRYAVTVILLLALLSVSCNPNLNKDLAITGPDDISTPAENPFLSACNEEAEHGAEGKGFTFLLLSDTHFGKSRITRSDSAFLKWAEEEKDGKLKDLAFITNLGDLTDDSREEEFEGSEELITGFRGAIGRADLPFFPVMGNHDNRMDGPAYFKQLVRKETGIENTTYYRFDWGEVQFYVLDTSFRTLGSRQRSYLEEALPADDGSPKVVLSHIPLHGSASVIYAALNDSQEIRQLLVDMKRGGVGAYLTGHQHAGNILYAHEFDDSEGAIYEFIASCFFSGTSRRLTARFYLCTYEPGDSSLSLQSYAYDSSADSYSDTPETEFILYL